ncbi:TolC family outer membrane protein [Caballeronia sp. LZ062]|uniref:TolC family outer membrane protein n=1 Tax=unclassified Caballeronia TaxID=2646786 RepID=UPI002857AC47|nr:MULTISPECIES: TolC family outer membrane protein [unclassified Caballeronia]MDR5856691.1 TolC family outer membrane protein [Caballeronia sp. LZ050]MDR5869911.1 TolC family outer membrane protein [Caballeronia sp. LZ062]
MFKRRIVLCALAGALVFVDAARADDLVAIVQQALDHDAELGQARAAYEAAKQAVPIARAALLPQIAGGWGRSYNRIDMDGFPRQKYWQNGWMVAVTQPLFDWSKWTAYRQADFVVAQGAVDFAGAQQASILRAVRAYFDELAAEDEVKRAADYLAAIDAQLQQVRRKRAVGEVTLIDQREADTAREQAQLQQTDAQEELSVKRRALQQVTGRPFAALASLPPGFALPTLAEGEEAWVEQARSRGYEVQSKQLGWEIARFDSTKSRAANYPVVSVTGSYTPAGAASGYARPTTTTTGMLQIQIPLFSGGELQARVKQSLALEDKAKESYELASNQAEASARENFAKYLRERQRTDALGHLVQSAGDTLSATEVGFKVGTRTGNDVLRAIDALYTARRDLLRSRYAAVVAFLQLKADVATLSTDDIADMNSKLCCTVQTSSADVR